ncbi:MAG: arsenate reductase family protein [Nitrososphaerales archaeon]
MAEGVKVYYKPTCMTCRKAIKKLDSNNVKFQLHDFFKDKLSKEDIRSLLEMAGLSARDVLRKKDKMYRELQLDKKKYSEEELVELIAKHPGLLLRPIIVRGNRAVIANKIDVVEEFCRRG